jgi:hypothetical protein
MANGCATSLNILVCTMPMLQSFGVNEDLSVAHAMGFKLVELYLDPRGGFQQH